jgi:FkbM family methyltransferase
MIAGRRMFNYKNSRDEALLSALRSSLSEREWQKIENLMHARGDSSLLKIVQNMVKVIPASVKPEHRVPQEVLDNIESIERENRFIRLDLKSGLTLRTFPSRQQYRNYYYCFRDLLPETVTPESYQPVHDITFRLDRGDELIASLKRRGLIAPEGDLNIIECGAYNGWKALGFARHIGETGKVIALEIDDEQFELCRMNLSANLPEERFQAIHSGIWHTVEEREYSFEHYASHSLRTPDEHLHHTQKKTIRTETLDSIIDQSGVELFDFLNIQTGGAELEAVQGLDRNLDAVKVMWVGSHYVHEGVSIRYRSVEHLLNRGCRVYYSSLNRERLDRIREITSLDEINAPDTGGIWAVSPAWRDKVVPHDIA